MRSHGHLYRLATAFLISVGLNVILFAVDFSIDPRREELSAIQRWVVGLLSPAEALTTGLVPGHGGLQIVALIVFSVVVYAIVSWVVLTLPGWWRRRA
jgi:hypothetical protein